jgi:choline dehydrogenase-like flavoprotein
VKDASDITLGTGHPQGGNPMSADPKKGVVDSEFRVHGFRNLYVVDASVFPTSIGVNPQLTVMALADYAVPLVK